MACPRLRYVQATRSRIMRLSQVTRVGVMGVLVLVGAVSVRAKSGAALVGRWDAFVRANDADVPFPFEIAADGSAVRGVLFNGERKLTSAPGKLEGDTLNLRFEQYAATLKLTVKDGTLTGEYVRPPGAPYPFRATKAAPRAASANPPSIDGTWIVSAKSNKGETAWRFIAKQKGADIDATILRVDGDTGTLTGYYRDGKFVLGHFSGARPLLLEVIPAADGTLTLRQNGKTELVAAREGAPRAASIGTPTDPAHHTSVKDPNEAFRFSFPDLQGKVVSNTDPKFAGKVVLVCVSGGGASDCHDEAPFLASLYKKYRSKG